MDIPTLAPLVTASRTLLGLVFLTSAAGKFRDPAAFHGAVHAYRLLPNRLIAPVAFSIPWVEVVIGFVLPSGLAPVASATMASALLGLFAVAMAINMVRGHRDIDCGCFRGRPTQRLTWGTVARTASLAGGAAFSGCRATISTTATLEGLLAGVVLFILFVTTAALPTLERKRPRISI